MSEKKYFKGLNYTLGNEDTTVEIELVKIYKPDSVFAVCGSGGRSLALAEESVKDLALSDLSGEQLLLAKLREATYKELDFEEFSLFWGYYPYGDDHFCERRKKIFEKLNLESDAREYFLGIFMENHFVSLLYTGKWEKTFQALARIARLMMGADFDRILRFDELSAQKNYYQKAFPLRRWKALLFLVGNKTLFNALLYKGSFIKKNLPESHFDFYFNAYERLFTGSLAQNSFFLQLCFYGKIKSLAGVPVEAKKEAHAAVKGHKGTIHYLNVDMIEHLSRGERQYNFLSLSDVPSYFEGDLERDFMQKIRPGLRPGAIIVNRYYLRVPKCDLKGFTDITSKHQKLVDEELVQMYKIKIYQYTPV
jgi:S-adenosylmethionine-diacylglycerol 3-amino-3-carboxypropyl transferase